MNSFPETGHIPDSDRSDDLPNDASPRMRSVRVRTLVLGLLLLIVSVGVLLCEVTSIRVDMTVAIVLLAFVGVGLFVSGLVSAVRQLHGRNDV